MFICGKIKATEKKDYGQCNQNCRGEGEQS